MTVVRGDVDDPRGVGHHGQEGVDHVLESPVVDVQRPLHLDEVLGGVPGWVEVHARVVDQDVHLALLSVDVIPQLDYTHNVGGLHGLERDTLGLPVIHLLP